MSVMHARFLVPKLHSGTHLSGQSGGLCRLAATVCQTKYKFADNVIPKCNLGTREF